MNTVSPRFLDAEAVAHEFFGRSRAWFSTKRKQLESIGFPRPCVSKDELGSALWDKRQINKWADTRSQISTDEQVKIEITLSDDEQTLLERANAIAQAGL